VEPGDRLAPSPSSSVDASSVRAEASDSEGGSGTWIRRIGGDDGSAWSPTYRPGVIRRLSDASDMETFSYIAADNEATIDIDISSPHTIE
jgi:hypothetical protein